MQETCWKNSKNFEYNVPSPDTDREFEFVIVTGKKAMLAEFLSMVVHVFYECIEDKLTEQNLKKATDFFNKRFDCEKPPSTWRLLCMANTFLPEEL